jgi:uncharacterized integral membrane protein
MGARKRNIKPATSLTKAKNETEAVEKKESKTLVYLVGVILFCVTLFFVQINLAAETLKVKSGKYEPGPAIVTTWKGKIFLSFYFEFCT